MLNLWDDFFRNDYLGKIQNLSDWADPGKLNVVGFASPNERNSVNIVFCCFFFSKKSTCFSWKKTRSPERMFPKPWLSKHGFGCSAGSTKLDRPGCKKNPKNVPGTHFHNSVPSTGGT